MVKILFMRWRHKAWAVIHVQITAFHADKLKVYKHLRATWCLRFQGQGVSQGSSPQEATTYQSHHHVDLKTNLQRTCLESLHNPRSMSWMGYYCFRRGWRGGRICNNYCVSCFSSWKLSIRSQHEHSTPSCKSSNWCDGCGLRSHTLVCMVCLQC